MSKPTFDDCVTYQQHIRGLMIKEGTAPVLSGRLARQLEHELKERWQRAFGEFKAPVVRMGDFDARNTHGSMHEMKCVKCGLAGIISIPEFALGRTQCPRCHKVPLDQWQARGQAGLLPPEPKTKHKQIITADSIDDMPYVTETEDGEGVEAVELDTVITEGVLGDAPDSPAEVDEDGMPILEEEDFATGDE